MNCRRAAIPLLASPQGGVAASLRKFRAATEADAAGVVFHLFSSENHPGLAISGCFATFLLVARPPLLAVMQGGESRLIPNHSHLHRPRLRQFVALPKSD